MNPLVFPVLGGTFESTWHAPRSGGREHEGVDIFAPLRAPVFAIASGQVRATEGTNEGIGIALTEPDGTRYSYAHLDGREGEFPRNVEAGELIGYVGNTGNAVGLPPHVHFETRPEGGEKIDPAGFLRELGNQLAREVGDQLAESAQVIRSGSGRGTGLAFGAVVVCGLATWGIYYAATRRRRR